MLLNDWSTVGILLQYYQQTKQRMQNKKSKGITRNKTEQLHINKQSKRKKSSRFAKQNLLGLSEYSPSPSTLRNPLTIEMQNIPAVSVVTPDWVEKYSECLGLIKSIEDIKKQILTEQSRRLSLIKMSEEKESERKIYDLTMNATKKIKECEKLLDQIKKQNISSESESDIKTRNNVCMSLAVTIQQKTKELRSQQKAFIEHRQHLENSTKVSFLELAAEKAYDPGYMEDNLQDEEQLQLELKVNAERNEQILKIVQSVYQLNDLYKELNNLVIVQGSLLDRIDYNIQESAVHVKKAEETLARVDDRQRKSKCSCIVIAIMLLAVIILGIILIVKWSKK